MQSFFQAAEFLQFQKVQFTIERVYKRSRKTKLRDSSEIIHQKLPIFDKTSFIKAQKNSIIFKVLEQKEFVCKTLKTELSRHSCTSFARRKHLNGPRRLKKYTMKACAEFYCHQIAKKILSKIPAMHY